VRKVLGGLLVVAVSLAAVVALVLVLQARDDAEVDGAGGPGERVTDRCPPQPASVVHDRRRLSRAQLETALAQGNVVILYAGPRPPVELRRLQRDVSGPFDVEIAAAGQAVILAQGPQPVGYEARAWGRRLSVEVPQDQRLREFAEAWLGEGAPKHCPS
jgi:Protein of unknown function (DUF3105)